MYYEEVFRELSQKNVNYLIIGGVALVLHGVLRMTADLDLLLEMETVNLIKFTEAMQALGYKPKLPVPVKDFLDVAKRKQWIQEKNLQAFSFIKINSYQIIDILINTPLDFSQISQNKKIIKAKGINIPIISITDLIQLKRFAGRPQDLADITAIEQLIFRKS